MALPSLTRSLTPVGGPLLSWEVDLLTVLHAIDGNALGISPKLRRQWRGCQVRLAVELARRGVRAPPLVRERR